MKIVTISQVQYNKPQNISYRGNFNCKKTELFKAQAESYYKTITKEPTLAENVIKEISIIKDSVFAIVNKIKETIANNSKEALCYDQVINTDTA